MINDEYTNVEAITSFKRKKPNLLRTVAESFCVFNWHLNINFSHCSITNRKACIHNSSLKIINIFQSVAFPSNENYYFLLHRFHTNISTHHSLTANSLSSDLKLCLSRTNPPQTISTRCTLNVFKNYNPRKCVAFVRDYLEQCNVFIKCKNTQLSSTDGQFLMGNVV